MIAIVHSIYSQSVHAPALDEHYCVIDSSSVMITYMAYCGILIIH